MDVGLLDAAAGARPADLAVTGGRLVNVFTEEIYPADVAVAGERIVAVGDVSEYVGEGTVIVDAAGCHLVPGPINDSAVASAAPAGCALPRPFRPGQRPADRCGPEVSGD